MCTNTWLKNQRVLNQLVVLLFTGGLNYILDAIQIIVYNITYMDPALQPGHVVMQLTSRAESRVRQ